MLIELTDMTQGIISASRIGDGLVARQLGKDVEAKVTKMVMPCRGGRGDSQGIRDNTYGRGG
jgi:hypothetical protein